jgi:Acyclic terpene utilisation family protein AtuA
MTRPAEPAAAPGAAPVLRIANCSGFYGDRLSAAQEMVDGGPIDVLTGDWLAELTMLLLGQVAGRWPPGLRADVPGPAGAGAACLPGPGHKDRF